MADNEVMRFEDRGPRGRRVPRAVFDSGDEPDPLYTLANERTYLAWLRFSVTLLAAAVAVDRLFLERPRNGSELLALGLVAIAVVACGLGVRRWWVTERSLRLRRPLPGFGTPLLTVLAVLLVGGGVVVLVVTPRG
jgi:putative membrane protein